MPVLPAAVAAGAPLRGPCLAVRGAKLARVRLLFVVRRNAFGLALLRLGELRLDLEGVPATIGEQAIVGVAGLGLTENETNRVESVAEITGQGSGGQQTHIKHSPSVIIKAAHRVCEFLSEDRITY
eukprot:4248556-Pleurochrysis_carterae.AAC.1